MLTTATDLPDLLDLETVETGLFRGRAFDGPAHRLFGGQVAAQALIAAGRTVGENMREHSLHAYFLRPGDSAIPVVYQVDRLHDGRNFARRRVTAVQHGQAILCMETSFTTDTSPIDHQVAAPAVPGPEGLPERSWPVREDGFAAWKPFEMRLVPVEQGNGVGPEWPPYTDMWFRLRDPMPDGTTASPASVLTYVSDLTLAASILRPTGRTEITGLTSLDHVMWFHSEVSLDGWLLYAKSCPAVGPLRGLAEGRIFTQDGRLIATVAQEGLIHAPRPAATGQ
jgi:acyl-CoA thioesterase-2